MSSTSADQRWARLVAEHHAQQERLRCEAEANLRPTELGVLGRVVPAVLHAVVGLTLLSWAMLDLRVVYVQRDDPDADLPRGVGFRFFFGALAALGAAGLLLSACRGARGRGALVMLVGAGTLVGAVVVCYLTASWTYRHLG